ncbi:hypothetical protein MQA28_25855, partial [Escherichia coli]|nr:hypothetical protein [Escherichia coli]
MAKEENEEVEAQKAKDEGKIQVIDQCPLLHFPLLDVDFEHICQLCLLSGVMSELVGKCTSAYLRPAQDQFSSVAANLCSKLTFSSGSFSFKIDSSTQIGALKLLGCMVLKAFWLRFVLQQSLVYPNLIFRLYDYPVLVHQERPLDLCRSQCLHSISETNIWFPKNICFSFDTLLRYASR